MVDLSQPDGCDATARWMFLRSLKASRLLAEREVDDIVGRHPEASLSQLKAVLVGDGLLTPYQLHRVINRDTDGLVFGQYRVLNEVGRGGFGEVYLARHTLMGRTVALKVIGQEWAKEPAGRAIFLREVTGATTLTHPHIALSYDAGECDGRLYMAMEYVDGPTLEGYLRSHGPLAPAELVAVLAETAEALRFADECGVVHRDLKPANILLAPRPAPAAVPFTVKVIDFGLARFQHRKREQMPVGTLMCEQGSVVGTPHYMSPEQAADVHSADIRSDLYSLGCTVYQAATGRLPFNGSTTQQVLDAVYHGRVIPIRQWRADVPDWLIEVIDRLMARRPEDRYQSPAELLAALAAGRFGPVAYPPPPPPVSTYSQWPVRPARPAYDARPLTPRPQPDRTHLEEAGSSPLAVLDADHDPGARETDTPVQLTIHPMPELPPAAALPAAPAVPAAPPEDFAPWWQEWHRQVGRLAGGATADLSDPEYRTLQRTLLHAIQGATDGPAAAMKPRLLAIVEPWVSLKSLTALDSRTLRDVWSECQRLDAGVVPEKPKRKMFGLW